MPKTHSPYPPEFRRQMVELVRAGRTPRELAGEFECSDQTIRNWVRQTDLDEGRSRGSAQRSTHAHEEHEGSADAHHEERRQPALTPPEAVEHDQTLSIARR